MYRVQEGNSRLSNNPNIIQYNDNTMSTVQK